MKICGVGGHRECFISQNYEIDLASPDVNESHREMVYLPTTIRLVLGLGWCLIVIKWRKRGTKVQVATVQRADHHQNLTNTCKVMCDEEETYDETIASLCDLGGPEGSFWRSDHWTDEHLLRRVGISIQNMLNVFKTSSVMIWNSIVTVENFNFFYMINEWMPNMERLGHSGVW